MWDFWSSNRLFEHEIHGSNYENECKQMVPLQSLALEHNVCNKGEHDETDALLHHLELDKRERASVALKPDTIGRHLAAVFEEGNAP